MPLTFPVTMVLRCYKRPMRTRRMLECILNQTLTGFELIAIGDACEDFRELIRSDWFQQWKEKFRKKGNEIFYMNSAIPGRDWGAKITNIAIKIARGKNFMFADNDDIIEPEHIRHYYNAMEKSYPADFVYVPVYIHNGGHHWIMEPHLQEGSIGHCSLIINTSFLRGMPKHEAVYGQDWRLVQHMMAAGIGKKADLPKPTYKVMSRPGKEEVEID